MCFALEREGRQEERGERERWAGGREDPYAN